MPALLILPARYIGLSACIGLALLAVAAIAACAPQPGGERVTGQFMQLILGDAAGRENALNWVEAHWRPDFTPFLLETIAMHSDAGFQQHLSHLLAEKTGVDIKDDIDQWYRWWWAQDTDPYAGYGEFKSIAYTMRDPAFRVYFGDGRQTRVALDEIRWGGVQQDGIPPLHQPVMVAAAQAEYLEDGNVVFGIEVNGDARAYPKRILAHHELFSDEVGEVPVVGVYCTLCGAMILYESQHKGVTYELGTSGFLYRSNKLMYDKATNSLWNSIWGEPVIGPLANEGIHLQRRPVVTTTWGEWRRRHPDTQVLDIETGFTRDYGEGVAYKDYFASPDLMFPVPTRDERLAQKDEVLAIPFGDSQRRPLAIALDYLADRPIYQEGSGEDRFVIFTDSSGASRVYESSNLNFSDWDQDATVTDESGARWRLTEAALVAQDGRRKLRIPAHRAYWFGWHAAFPDTRLVQ